MATEISTSVNKTLQDKISIKICIQFSAVYTCTSLYCAHTLCSILKSRVNDTGATQAGAQAGTYVLWGTEVRSPRV